MKRFAELAKAKFMDGQKRHGGCILDRNHFWEAECEVIDMWMYVQAWREREDMQREEYEAEIKRLKDTITVMKQDA